MSGQLWSKSGVDSGPELVDSGPIFVGSAQALAGIGRGWSNFGESRATSSWRLAANTPLVDSTTLCPQAAKRTATRLAARWRAWARCAQAGAGSKAQRIGIAHGLSGLARSSGDCGRP